MAADAAPEEAITISGKTEGILAVVAALLVLLSATLDARVSATVAILALAALGIYKLLQKDK